MEVLFSEVSAKTGDNVNSLFKMIASTLPGNENSQFLIMGEEKGNKNE